MAPKPISNSTIPIVSRALLLDNSTQGKIESNDSLHPDSVVYIFRLVLSCVLLNLLWTIGLKNFIVSAVLLLFWPLFYVAGLQERVGIDKE